MRKLALSDKILLKVDKAARYIGGEVNSVMKDKNEIDIRFAMCFPDVYEIDMSVYFSPSFPFHLELLSGHPSGRCNHGL